MKHIDRPLYLDRLRGLLGTPDIKIITGIRRCGKSDLMKTFISQLMTGRDDINVIYVDYYDLRFEDLKDYKRLHAYVQEHREEGKSNLLFIDEVQLCPGFELAVNSLHNSGSYDIYLTGSNAFLLSSDLATLFTGRFIEIPVYPFSFSEFCQYRDYSSGGEAKRDLLDEYVRMGGLAGSYEYYYEQDRVAYLWDVYLTIIRRDLVDKYRIADPSALEHISEYMMDNISNITSPSRISSALTANSFVTNHVTAGKYIRYLCDAFLFYPFKRYDIKGKRYLESSEKYYLADLGLRYAVLGNRNPDYGRAYENIVALELKRRGFDVYVGKLYQKEVDFIAVKQDRKLYIQVADSISDPQTLSRETSPLLQIRDAYPKLIIANTGHPEYQYEGIRIIDLAEWLLSNE